MKILDRISDNKAKVIGICGDRNTGKSNLAYHLIQQLQERKIFKLYSYGLRLSLGEQKIYSVEELERISNSVVFLDEFYFLLELDNRKKTENVQRIFQNVNHSNIILVLIGLPQNFNKFISAKLDIAIMKQTTLADLINGSPIKHRVMSYSGNERGGTILKLPVDESIMFEGEHYYHEHVPYYKIFDTKANNPPIFTDKVKRG